MIHENVRKIRDAKGVTKTHLAKKLNLSLQGYIHVESGSTKLSAERLRLIASALNVEVAVFFDNELTNSVIKQMNSDNKQAI